MSPQIMKRMAVGRNTSGVRQAMKLTLPAMVAMGALALLAGCAGKTRSLGMGDGRAPLFQGMGGHHYAVTTSSKEAQRYFDQGLVWAFAFNHDEAIRSFEEAARLDPDCAMAWWGAALCHGPHINNPAMTPDRSQAAWDALQKAEALRAKASRKEQALINALAKRYANPAPEDRKPLDGAYAKAMAEVWRAFPDDPDIGVLYAEAMMDLRPWDLWTKEGQPQPGTEVILATLEEAMRQNPMHPGANHLYIHAVEASPHPDRANAAANRLRKMVPASGHLVHMPSHIDVLTGRWAQASEQNEAAIEADRKYRTISPKQGFYRLYMVHNEHMLAFASMMEGRSEAAIAAGRRVIRDVPEEELKSQAAFLDVFASAKYDPLKRFGRWDDLLAEPAPPDFLPITTALWRFHRGLAYAAKGSVAAAEQEQAAFHLAVLHVPESAVGAINPARDILKIADCVLAGEIALGRGDLSTSIAELRKGVAAEDALRYMEPPEWPQPVRHTLGAALLRDGQYVEAEKVYREDLAKWPENGWSLYGLGRALRSQGKNAEALEVEARLKKAWSRADVPMTTSCLCIPQT